MSMLHPTWSNFECFLQDFLGYFGSHKIYSFSTSPDVFYSLICVVGTITSQLRVWLKIRLNKMSFQTLRKVSELCRYSVKNSLWLS